jgi:hypothetical protein
LSKPSGASPYHLSPKNEGLRHIKHGHA